MQKQIYINSQGGLGFNLALAAMTKELKGKYEKVCVLSPYYDIFECSKYVDTVYKPSEIRDFIFDAKYNNARLICERMYDSEDFIYKKASYADAWRKAAGLPLHNNKEGSDTILELETNIKYPGISKQVQDVLEQLHTKDKYEKFMIMQFTGGQSPLVKVPVVNGKQDWSKVRYNYENEPLKRHYPIHLAQEFINKFREKNPDTAIVMYQLPNEPCPKGKGVYNFVMPYLAYYELARNGGCRGAVTIDSSLQHLLAGVTQTFVIWGHSLPLSFGYNYNMNLVQDCRRDDILYFSALGPSGAKIDYIQPDKLLEKVTDWL